MLQPENQGLLHRDVKDYFAEVKGGNQVARQPTQEDLSYAETVTLDHGRKEVRRCWVSDDVTWVSGYEKWAGLCLIAMIEYVRDVYTESRVERRYYISSRALTASGLMEAVRHGGRDGMAGSSRGASRTPFVITPSSVGYRLRHR